MADANGDGVVDLADFEYCTGPRLDVVGLPPACDFDGDGYFSGPDLDIFAACEGIVCTAAAAAAAQVPSLTPAGSALAAAVMLVGTLIIHGRRRGSG